MSKMLRKVYEDNGGTNQMSMSESENTQNAKNTENADNLENIENAKKLSGTARKTQIMKTVKYQVNKSATRSLKN